MKAYLIKYQWFKLIKSFEVSAINNNEAKKEFLRLNKNVLNENILKCIRL